MKKIIAFSLLLFLGFACKKETPIVEEEEPVVVIPEEEEETPTLPKMVGFENNSFTDEDGKSFFPWGFNYTNPEKVGLIEDNWDDENTWSIISSDFEEMKGYGANTVRIHLQYNKFMESPDMPNSAALEKLKRLVKIAEENNIYLIVTGLASYRLSDSPAWYDSLNDQQRRDTHKVFWKAIAATLKTSNGVFAYDLINEPVIGVGCGQNATSCDWYPDGGQLGGFQFIQNIALTPSDNFWITLADWINEMTTAIRTEDENTMITAGLLNLGPVNSVAPNVDIVSAHVYPKKEELSKSVDFVLNNQSDKPFLLEEFGRLHCSIEEMESVLNDIDGKYHGMIGHYFGKTLEEHENTIVDALHKEFLEFFIANNPN